MMDWEVVCTRLGEILGINRTLEWRHLDSLRSVVLPESKEISRKLLNLKYVHIKGDEEVELHRWFPGVFTCVIHDKPRKIGIRSLPLHLWLPGFFQAIGGWFFEG